MKTSSLEIVYEKVLLNMSSLDPSYLIKNDLESFILLKEELREIKFHSKIKEKVDKYHKQNGDKDYYINLLNSLLLPRSTNWLNLMKNIDEHEEKTYYSNEIADEIFKG